MNHLFWNTQGTPGFKSADVARGVESSYQVYQGTAFSPHQAKFEDLEYQVTHTSAAIDSPGTQLEVGGFSPTHLKNMRKSNWSESPQVGMKLKKYISCHHLDKLLKNNMTWCRLLIRKGCQTEHTGSMELVCVFYLKCFYNM